MKDRRLTLLLLDDLLLSLPYLSSLVISMRCSSSSLSLLAHSRDLPPAGGYEPIRYKRNLPARGPGGIAIFGGVIAICAFGLYKVGQSNLEARELKREKAWSRIHLVPMILAEADRDSYRREQAQIAREKEVMKDVPGWEAGKSVYNTKRYTPGNFAVV